jgi:hypothetical protein
VSILLIFARYFLMLRRQQHRRHIRTGDTDSLSCANRLFIVVLLPKAAPEDRRHHAFLKNLCQVSAHAVFRGGLARHFHITDVRFRSIKFLILCGSSAKMSPHNCSSILTPPELGSPPHESGRFPVASESQQRRIQSIYQAHGKLVE